jgi:nucleoid-associated protein EbfC
MTDQSGDAPQPSLDLGALMAQAQSLMGGLMKAQEEVASQEFTGTAGSGAVTVTMEGDGEVTEIRIDPGVVNPDEVDLLEDLILAALRDAAAKVAAAQGSGLGGLDLGALGGLLGPGGS